MRNSEQKGTILITLVVSITIFSVLSAAILSFNTSSGSSVLHSSHSNRAYYLAESGYRYAKLRDFPDTDNYTVMENKDGTYKRINNEPLTGPPQKIDTQGFRISIEDCEIRSTGIVREGTTFEARAEIGIPFFNKMPCWNLDNYGSGFFADSCGQNRLVPASGGSVYFDEFGGRYNGAVQFSGGYAETTFRPFCEIGNAASFTVSFWAKPDTIGDSIVLGVRDNDNRFSAGISGGYWMAAYGDQELYSTYSAESGKWQRITITYDKNTNKFSMGILFCNSPDDMVSTTYTGSAIMPEPGDNNSLFVGAENMAGIADSYFFGFVDEIQIYDHVQYIGGPPVDAPVAYYPFDGNPEDKSGPDGMGNGNNGIENGAILTSQGRFGCLNRAYIFDGQNSYIHIPEGNKILDLRENGTLSLWIKPDVIPPFARIIMNGNPQTISEFSYALSLSKHTVMLELNISGASTSLNSLTTIVQNQWYHIGATWEHVGNHMEVILYINGIKDNFLNIGYSLLAESDNGIYIGTQLFTIGNIVFPFFTFQGSMDEVIFYDRALTPAEILKLKEDGPPIK